MHLQVALIFHSHPQREVHASCGCLLITVGGGGGGGEGIIIAANGIFIRMFNN